ncbi:MAG: NAD(P)H-hydrate dehydratase, partial [Oscillospiraceae bacterium]|nr:NAD(P)H-hydrate dehydratase [Oscillospiraceae bacterium]
MEPITRDMVRALLPPRPKTAHKGDFGRVLALAGSIGTSGAAYFCGMAAVRGGAGLVTMGLPERIWEQVASGARECMCFPLPCDGEGRLDARAFPWIEKRLEKADVCVCGPGIGTSRDLSNMITLLTNGQTPLVLDADGINNKSGHILNCPLVLTPHEGEFLRMGGDLSRGRAAGGLAYVERNPCVLVLKGHETLVFAPGG